MRDRPPTLALTATATPEVQEDIMASLGFRTDPSERSKLVTGVIPDHLHFSVELPNGKDEKEARLRELVDKNAEDMFLEALGTDGTKSKHLRTCSRLTCAS